MNIAKMIRLAAVAACAIAAMVLVIRVALDSVKWERGEEQELVARLYDEFLSESELHETFLRENAEQIVFPGNREDPRWMKYSDGLAAIAESVVLDGFELELTSGVEPRRLVLLASGIRSALKYGVTLPNGEGWELHELETGLFSLKVASLVSEYRMRVQCTYDSSGRITRAKVLRLDVREWDSPPY